MKTSTMWMCVVAREDKELYYPEIKVESFPKSAEILNTFGITSLFYIPIKLGKKIFGTLSFLNLGGTMYLTEFEKDIIRSRALLIARAIENSKLYNELKTKTIALEQKDRIISEDLMIAKRIQSNVISDSYKSIQDLDVQIYFKPMIEVGGDIYDIFKLKENYYRIFLADATGHGVQGALGTMIIKTEYEKIKVFDLPANIILENFNKIFYRDYFKLGMFFSCILVDIDLNENKAYYSLAGNPKQYLIQKNLLSEIYSKGKMIGIFEQVKFMLSEKDFQKGDTLLLFTDGLFEEFSDKTGDELDEEGLEKLFMKHINDTPNILMKNIVQELNNFIGTNAINDDITFLVIKNKYYV